MGLLNVTGEWTGSALLSTANFSAGEKGKVEITPADRDVLRSLAEEVAAWAAKPAEREKRALWRAHNDLKSTRAPVFCDPENGWNEIITADQLRCRGAMARRWEIVLRKELFWASSMKDDKVIEPFFDIGYTHRQEDWEAAARQRGGQGGSYVWEPLLKAEEDIEALPPSTFEVDYETTEETVKLARDTFGDLLPVRLRGVWWWSLGRSYDLALLRGMEQIMLDMIERPRMVHRLMGIIRDGCMKKLDQLEANDLLSTNTDLYVGSGGFGYTRHLPDAAEGRTTRTNDMWGFCESQETVGISPEMFAEFIFPYQLPILERFGLNCYGCCEPLDGRWQVVSQAPNLRRVSVSAWADLGKMASLLGDRYIFSWKPAPADLVGPHIDEAMIRAKIRAALDIARGCRMEIIMKDNHTIGHNPDNVVQWARIAREESERSHG